MDHSKRGAPITFTHDEFMRRLRDDANAIEDIFVSVPTTSSYYYDIGYPPPSPPPPANLTEREHRIAATVFDVHSRICAWRLLATWRSSELVAAAMIEFESDQLIAASSLVRSLFENAAALDVESTLLAELWQPESSRVAFDENAALQWRSDVSNLLLQPLWGTREYPKIDKWHPERTQICDLIKQASKHTGKSHLRTIYNGLCDVVHPCLGSNSAYYAGSGLQGSYPDLIYIELSKGSNNFDGLRPLLLDAWQWSMRTTEAGLRRIARVGDCLCMAAKLYAYGGLLYWGVVHPTCEDDLCPCGSGIMLSHCNHGIPPDVISGKSTRLRAVNTK
jgi:hypothetical protein